MGSESRFDEHRFDNHTAWLDRETRGRAFKEGRHPGYGFALPKPPPPPKEERTFQVTERAFTSGLIVKRNYVVTDTSYKTETERSDPYHYPNHLEVKEHHHYQSAVRRSQNVDPKVWKPNPEYANLVTDDMVKTQLSAHLGEARQNIDPKMLGILFDDGSRALSESSRSSLATSSLPMAGQGPGGSRKWQWCMGGRKQLAFDRGMDEEELSLRKSQSLPQMTLSNQPSMLAGNLGGSATSTFHGLHTRKFGGGKVQGAPDLRMRGAGLAKSGRAGTFPEQDGVMYNGGPL